MTISYKLIFLALALGICLAGASEAASQFVANQSCIECHRSQAQDWLQSHHAWAMREADDATVKGDFAEAIFEYFGATSRFFKDKDQFMVATEGPDGEPHEYAIKYTFGIDPLQQYLIEFPDGRLQALSIAWDTRDKEQGGQRWFHLYPHEKIAADDPLHWTGRYQNWNGMCAECHSTNLEKRYDPQTDSYASRWSEINVSCQSCHGPGSEHVAWARAASKGETETETETYAEKDESRGLVVNYKTSDARFEIDSCARCHSRRRRVSAEDSHGRSLLDDFMPTTLREGLYHPDGQILDEVYVYGSFLQSKMYQAGVRCTDCHNPHSGELKITGSPNAVCMQCHNPVGNPRFAQLLRKNYNSPEHHFHPPDSPGALCVNCHMPAKTYMVIDGRRDHSFRIPRPDLTIKIGTPNACNQCHEDQSARWAGERIEQWYGPDRDREKAKISHYGEVFAAARAGRPDAQQDLSTLLKEPQPAIVRATAAELLQASNPQTFQALLDAAYDDDPLVRAAAVAGFTSLPAQYKQKALAPLLQDATRAVRTEAARVLASIPPDQFSKEQQESLQDALAEYRAAQFAVSDVMPGAHLNLAVLEENQGNMQQAEQHYRKAIAMDPDFLPARVNLANLYNAQKRNQEAEQVFREAVKRAPEQGELHYSLGLLLAEEQRIGDSAAALGNAARLLPERPRVQYNYALALQHLGRLDEAEAALLKAYRLERRNADFLQALAIFYSQQKRWDDAYPYVEQLVRLYPDAPGPRQMLEQLKALKKYGVRQ